MRRLTTLGRGSYLRGRFFNALQDEQRGRAAATQNPAGALALVGGDGRYACTPDAGVADGTLAVLDTGIDWRARLIAGYLVRLEGSSQRLHGANAWQSNDVTRPIAVRRFRGSTGTGGLGAAAATVANGTPPVVASGSFAVVVDEGSASSSRVWLYARPSDGALCVYNASGSTLHAEFDLESSAIAPNPSAPPPDVIPTLTDVQWMTGTAAARPADPGGPTLYRATDGGAFSVYDGGAWRALGGGGGSTIPDPDGPSAILHATEDGLSWRALGFGDALAAFVEPNLSDVQDLFGIVPMTSGTTPTSDATPTLVASFTVAANRTRMFKVYVTASSVDGSEHNAAWERTVAVRADPAGTITSLGSVDVLAQTTPTDWDPDPTTHVRVSIIPGSPGGITVSVIGLAGVSLAWNSRIQVTG